MHVDCRKPLGNPFLTTDLRESLQAALGPAYAIERELGGGGMSRVFLATEIALNRQVVVKVLPPELAAGLSADRFRREIQLAARLQHPHIVPVLAAGEAGEFVFYTMPFVAGESLRARLQRQGELPVPLAARFMTEIARALAYAHRQGVVHRDIKPENVLLAEEEAQVADFGIAKAVSASAEGGTLTSVGLAIGTPAYMAPEQAAADTTADHRIDLYALGVVAYEMIAGQPPFSGRTAAQLLAAHATQPVPPLATLRPTVPAALAELVMQLLEKRPADRPQTADEVLGLLTAAATPAQELPTVRVPTPAPEPAGPGAVAPAGAGPRRGRWMIAGGVAALALVASLAWLRGREKPAAVDRRVVAVAPFRVTGADSSLAYLREGMVDLLAAKLSGTTALRPADPRTVLARWKRSAGGGGDLPQEEAARLAAAVGAGQLLQGDVVGTPQRITLNATLIEAPGGGVRARASVEGTADSLTRLVDQLAARLLALGAGEAEQRIEGLTSTSLTALRAYLDGQALLRAGGFHDATARFEEALRLDSSFALAGLGVARAGEWYGYDVEPAVRAAWKHRDRLSPVDRAEFDVVAAKSAVPRPESFRDQIKAGERFVALAPSSPAAWYELGDLLYHYGALAGLPESIRRAAQAFSRSLALDSAYAPTLQHLTELGAHLEDTTAIRRGLALLLRVDSMSPIAEARRWHTAALVGDSFAAARALASDSMLELGAFYVTFFLLDHPVNLAGTDAMIARAYASRATDEQRRVYGIIWRKVDLIRGRVARAHQLPADLSTDERLLQTLVEGMFGGGDSAAAFRAAEVVEGRLGTPLNVDQPFQVGLRWAVGQYALQAGRHSQARRAMSDLRSAKAPPDSAWRLESAHLLALLLEAQLAPAGSEGSAPLRELDSLLLNTGRSDLAQVGNLVAARLHERSGDLAGALAAVRRRVYGIGDSPVLVTYRREEGRLAALTGDRAGAIRAYRHYLAMRDDPDPSLRPQRDSVLAELRALERESTDRP